MTYIMIGVFDSGLGGLTVLKKFLEKLPQYDYIYFGDNARAPYGNKSQNIIYQYTQEAVEFLLDKNCQLVIIACNTASAEALRKIQREFLPQKHPDKKVLGIIIPVVEGVEEYYQKNTNKKLKKRVGVIGTRATIESGAYNKEFYKRNKKLEIFSQSTPLLVPLIEEGWHKKPETKKILKKYLRPLKQKEVDVLIPGCTHYPFLLKEMKKIMGKQTFVVDAPAIISEKLDLYLKNHPEIENKLSKNKKRLYYISDKKSQFKNISEKFLGKKIEIILKK